MPRPKFDSEKCKACQMCITVCPNNIFELGSALNSKGYAVIQCKDEILCIGCMLCAKMCPDMVIEIYK